jgi:hypothetical protein
MKKIFLVLFVIAIGMTNCSTPNPATTTDSDTLNRTRTSPDTSMMSRDSTVRRDSLRLP